jgi:DNA-binding NarL/FixJ family response regulator
MRVVVEVVMYHEDQAGQRIDTRILDRISLEFRIPKAPQAVETIGLTQRQQQVFKLIQEGKCEKEIAAALFISLGTIAMHKRQIFRKFGVSNTKELLHELSLKTMDGAVEDAQEQFVGAR